MTLAESRALTEGIASWVKARSDLKALGLVGSWARGDARPDSDLDLLILADNPAVYRLSDDWLYHLPLPEMFRVSSHKGATYGVVWSCHALLQSGAELELTFAAVDWAATDPIDASTRDIVLTGFRVIVDKDGSLRRLAKAIQNSN